MVALHTALQIEKIAWTMKFLEGALEWMAQLYNNNKNFIAISIVILISFKYTFEFSPTHAFSVLL